MMEMLATLGLNIIATGATGITIVVLLVLLGAIGYLYLQAQQRLSDLQKEVREILQKHPQDIKELSDQRIDDLKEVTADYNALVKLSNEAVERLARAIK